MIMRELILTLVLAGLLIGGLFKLQLLVVEGSAEESVTVLDKAGAVRDVSEQVRIAVGIGILADMAKELVTGSDIEIVPAFTAAGRLFSQGAELAAGKVSKELILDKISACISLRSISGNSGLYSYLRAKNIRIIEIDCGNPPEKNRRSVSVIVKNESATTGMKYYEDSWLSPVNAQCMLDLMAQDIIAIAPEWKDLVIANQQKMKQQITVLPNEFNNKLSAYDNLDVVTLCDCFQYFIQSFQLYLLAVFPDNGRAWSEERLNKLSKFLKDNEVKIVLHRWEPNADVTAAIKGAGAELVILDPLDYLAASGKTYYSQMKGNIDSLEKALGNQ